jgi:hypothetical protein
MYVFSVTDFPGSGGRLLSVINCGFGGSAHEGTLLRDSRAAVRAETYSGGGL